MKQYLCPGTRSRETLARESRAEDAATHPEVTGESWEANSHSTYTAYCGPFAYLSAYLPADLPTYLPTYLSTDLRTYLPTYLPAYLPTYLATYLPTYLPTYLATCQPTYIPIYMSENMFVEAARLANQQTCHGLHSASIPALLLAEENLHGRSSYLERSLQRQGSTTISSSTDMLYCSAGLKLKREHAVVQSYCHERQLS